MENSRFTTAEIAYYLTDRLKGKRAIALSGKKGELKKQLTKLCGGKRGNAQRLDAIQEESALSQLEALIREREDLVRQIVVDEQFGGNEEKSISQDEIISALEGAHAIENTHVRSLTGRMRIDQSLEGAVERAKEHLKDVRKKIAEVVADPRIAEGYRARVENTVGIVRTARNVGSLRRLNDRCELSRMQLIARRSSEDLPLSSADVEIMQKYDTITEKAQRRIEDLVAREEIYYETKRRELLKYRRQLIKGGFVKTASIQREILRVLSHLQLGIPVFLRGHLGVGKTELALHVCREYLGAEPEFISGSEEATKYDIYGRTQIGVTSEEDRLAELRRRLDQYRSMNPDAGSKDLKEAEKRYYDTIVVRGQASSFFEQGPLVRAMKEGKPLIIDEMDGIPHSIIMRMNHVLTRRPGDRVRVQEGGGEQILVQKGFCVIATGNVKSARYKREELDAAFLSRWWSEDIAYPPQEETYEILTAALIDRRGDLQVKNPTDLDDLKRLTEVAAEIQAIFMGDHLDYLGEGADAARGVPAGLKKSVLSLRHLWNIVRPWKANNFDNPIEYYILNEFIKPAVAEDQVYLVQLFCRFRFFKDWKIGQIEIPGLTEAKLLAFQGRQAIPT